MAVENRPVFRDLQDPNGHTVSVSSGDKTPPRRSSCGASLAGPQIELPSHDDDDFSDIIGRAPSDNGTASPGEPQGIPITPEERALLEAFGKLIQTIDEGEKLQRRRPMSRRIAQAPDENSERRPAVPLNVLSILTNSERVVGESNERVLRARSGLQKLTMEAVNEHKTASSDAALAIKNHTRLIEYLRNPSQAHAAISETRQSLNAIAQQYKAATTREERTSLRHQGDACYANLKTLEQAIPPQFRNADGSIPHEAPVATVPEAVLKNPLDQPKQEKATVQKPNMKSEPKKLGIMRRFALGAAAMLGLGTAAYISTHDAPPSHNYSTSVSIEEPSTAAYTHLPQPHDNTPKPKLERSDPLVSTSEPISTTVVDNEKNIKPGRFSFLSRVAAKLNPFRRS